MYKIVFGFFVGVVSTFFFMVFIVGHKSWHPDFYNKYKPLVDEADISQCEANLPRNQRCILVAQPEE